MAVPTVLQVESLAFEYDRGMAILSEVSFCVEEGRFVAVVGANGSGKSTLMKILLGRALGDGTAYSRHAGTIRCVVRGRVGYLSQDYRSALFPSMTLIRNLSAPFDWDGERTNKPDISQVLRELEEEVGVPVGPVARNLERYPHEMSGGEQQIAAFVRTLIYRPSLIFLDEPFGSADPRYRRLMRDGLTQYCRRYGTTVVMISHDIAEALRMAHEVLALGPHKSGGSTIVARVPGLLGVPDCTRDCEALIASRVTDLQRCIECDMHS